MTICLYSVCLLICDFFLTCVCVCVCVCVCYTTFIHFLTLLLFYNYVYLSVWHYLYPSLFLLFSNQRIVFLDTKNDLFKGILSIMFSFVSFQLSVQKNHLMHDYISKQDLNQFFIQKLVQNILAQKPTIFGHINYFSGSQALLLD